MHANKSPIWRKTIYAIVGLIATVLAIIGVWLPGVPTTIFVLIALWAFGQTSPKLEAWFTRIPLLKQAVLEARRFQQEGTVRKSSKLVSQGCAWLSFVALLALFPHPFALIVTGLLAISCSAFMWWIPTTEPKTASIRD